MAPLNWGLGHVTRCIPIIKEFSNQNCELILVAGKNSFTLLKKEFPSMIILPFFGYNIKYSHSGSYLVFKLFLQLPGFLAGIYKEYKWLKKTIKNYQPDVIISDSRLGLYNQDIVSIYITHQLAIRTGNSILDKIARNIHYRFIKNYDQCWVPDFKENGLAGRLSHPEKLPLNTIYLGALSRFEYLPAIEKIYDLLISISGPEPQRTIFENIIFQQLKNSEKKILIVRGLPGEKKRITHENSFVEIVNHLSATDLSRAFQESELIVCRSGYTTIMDLIRIKKKAILVPTPGQTEQEYLASFLMKNKNFFSVKQKNFNLENALTKSAAFPYISRNDNMDTYKKIIEEFVHLVKCDKFST
ncbi:MAG: glycosyltransferase [Ginsengibacter sp.]